MDKQTLNDDTSDARYGAILAREFRKARGIAADTRLQVSFRPDELIIILEGSNIWVMCIGSDDDEFHFVDNDEVVLKFPMPQEWLNLEEQGG